MSSAAPQRAVDAHIAGGGTSDYRMNWPQAIAAMSIGLDGESGRHQSHALTIVCYARAGCSSEQSMKKRRGVSHPGDYLE